jgi:hypothetical protein
MPTLMARVRDLRTLKQYSARSFSGGASNTLPKAWNELPTGQIWHLMKGVE